MASPDERRGGPASERGAAGEAAGDRPPATAPSPDGAPPGEWVRVPDRRARRTRRRRRGCLVGLVVAALVVAAVAVGGYLFVRDYFAVGPRGDRVTVTIPEGATLSEIAAILEDAGVVPRAGAFEYRADRDGYGDRLRPGTYRLHVNEPYDDLVAALLAGVEASTLTVTIPEGLTARQTAALVAEGIPGFEAETYVDLTLVDPLPFNLQGFTSGGPLEGFLFPATYTVDPDITEEQFVRLQLRTFKERLGGIDLDKAHAHNFTDYDVTILGSMIEREIQVAGERSLAAAVMWNRLRLDMPLQIDATIQYALPEYKEELTYDDLKVDSPYNTYLHTGLPPTPIANPGAAALRAAAQPAAAAYLYYVARGDGSGRHRFSETYDQFLRDKAKAEAEAQ